MNKIGRFTFALIMMICLVTGGIIAPSYAQDKKSELIPLNQWTNQYSNYYVGYRMQVPSELKKDETAFDIRTRFYNDNMVLDIYHDNFKGTADSFASYRNYGNRSLFKESHFNVSTVYDKNISGRNSKVMYYSRPKLDKISHDQNYYASAEIPLSNKEVVTIVMKSIEPIRGFDELVGAFRLIDQSVSSFELTKRDPSSRTHSLITQAFMKAFFAKDSPPQFGIFEPSAPDNFVYLDNLEKGLHYNFPVILRYQDMDMELPLEALRAAKERDKVVELTLQTTKAADKNRDTTVDILNGNYDHYFNQYAKGLKELNYPVLFRLNNEMNGDWCQYSAYHYGKDADLYIALYRYIFDIFEKNGADNVLFVWNPNEISFPNFSWNQYMAYYPGDDYVDIVGLTGYNTGNYYRGERWRSFEEIYDKLYREYSSRFNHPLMITEFGSASYGGDKAAWMEDMFSKINRYDRIKLAIWWSGTDFDSNQQAARIYRIDESQATIEAAKKGLQNFKKTEENLGRKAHAEY